jgi:catechol 2,3-dioxygenase-like lactoylglutathione lyase family enzyme
MAKHWGAVINCADIDTMSDFWSATLGISVLRGDDQFRVLHGEHGIVALQRADDPVTYRDQMHFDVYCPFDDRDAEVDRIVGLGATYVRESNDADDPYVVLADPEGNFLCVCPVKELSTEG